MLLASASLPGLLTITDPPLSYLDQDEIVVSCVATNRDAASITSRSRFVCTKAALVRVRTEASSEVAASPSYQIKISLQQHLPPPGTLAPLALTFTMPSSPNPPPATDPTGSSSEEDVMALLSLAQSSPPPTPPLPPPPTLTVDVLAGPPLRLSLTSVMPLSSPIYSSLVSVLVSVTPGAGPSKILGFNYNEARVTPAAKLDEVELAESEELEASFFVRKSAEDAGNYEDTVLCCRTESSSVSLDLSPGLPPPAAPKPAAAADDDASLRLRLSVSPALPTARSQFKVKVVVPQHLSSSSRFLIRVNERSADPYDDVAQASITPVDVLCPLGSDGTCEFRFTADAPGAHALPSFAVYNVEKGRWLGVKEVEGGGSVLVAGARSRE